MSWKQTNINTDKGTFTVYAHIDRSSFVIQSAAGLQTGDTFSVNGNQHTVIASQSRPDDFDDVLAETDTKAKTTNGKTKSKS